MDKLGQLHMRERIALTAGHVPLAERQQRDSEAITRQENFLAAQAKRPLADEFYFQEVAQMSGVEDGRFLTQVLARFADEVRVLLIRGSTRELALVLTSIEQAEHWAIEQGRKTGSHTIIDRRTFQVNHQEVTQ